MILAVDRVSKTYPAAAREVRALDDVTLDVTEGECLAVVGGSGSGKSTLAGLNLGLTQPTRREIRLDGTALPARRTLAHRRAIQLVRPNPRPRR